MFVYTANVDEIFLDIRIPDFEVEGEMIKKEDGVYILDKNDILWRVDIATIKKKKLTGFFGFNKK